VNWRTLIAVFLWCAATKVSSDDLPLQEELGLPLRQPGLEIVWSTTLDSLPRSATVFHVVSKQYSPTTISNLLEITGFTMRDRVFHVGFGNRMLFRDPKNNGRKVLTVGSRMWLIVPGATNPVPITPNQRLLGGASFGDVAKLRFAEDFTAAVREGAETVAGRECRVLDLTAKDPRASYPKVILWVDPADHLARKVLFFLPSGKEAKEALFTKFSKVAGKTIISEMEIRDLLGRESRTVTRLQYLDYRPGKLDDALFTPEGAKGL